MYLMVPKPLDSFNLLRVKGKGLKQKVLHASCEWYGPVYRKSLGERRRGECSAAPDWPATDPKKN